MTTVKLCTFSGCNERVTHANDNTSPRCTRHTSATNKPRKIYEHHLDDSGRNIYKSARWKRVRKAKLTLTPLCEHCAKFGFATMASVVDHIREIKDGGEVWELNNLQSLCPPHHNTKTGKETRARNNSNNYPSLSNFK